MRPEHAQPDSGARARPARRVLLVCSHFWPSVGGIETSLGQLGAALVQAGHAVSVMTLPHPARDSDVRHGVRILSVPGPQLVASIRATIASGDHDTVVLIQDPLGPIVWAAEGVPRPAHTRLLIQPVINDDGYSRWRDNPAFCQRLTAILRGASAALVMTRQGPDTRFMRRAGLEPFYLPNASAPVAPAGDFRARFGIAPDDQLVLQVANLYPVKNHIGLIDALPPRPQRRLVMVGNLTHDTAYCQAVLAALAQRPDVVFIPGLPPDWVAAGMAASDAVVLASHGEGSPISLLEAMSHGRPWLATPSCGAANDHLGGRIAPLAQFDAALQAWQRLPALRQAHGQLAWDHWRHSHDWPVVVQGWLDLIDHGRLLHPFDPDPVLLARAAALGEAMDNALAHGSANPGADHRADLGTGISPSLSAAA